MAQVLTLGANGGRTLFGVVTAIKFDARIKGAPSRRTIKFAGRFVEYEPGAREPKRNDAGEVVTHGSTQLDAGEVAAMLRAVGAANLDAGEVGSMLAAINDAAAAGEPFAVRLPATARAVAVAVTPESIIAAAATFDPLA